MASVCVCVFEYVDRIRIHMLISDTGGQTDFPLLETHKNRKKNGHRKSINLLDEEIKKSKTQSFHFPPH